MNKKAIIFIVSISIFICSISLYTGLINEATLFGYNVFISIIKSDESQKLLNNNSTIVKSGAFAYKLLTNITIPDNITSIENSAFKGNKLTSVVIPSSVTSIGEKAFNKNRLTSITIGSNVTLGRNAFGFGFEDAYNKNGLTTGTYMRDDTKSNEWSTWQDNLRYEKNNSGTSVAITDYNGTGGKIIIPDTINNRSVTVISDQAFNGKKLTSVIIPDSVTRIGESAFSNNQLTNINISNNITYIRDYSFMTNHLTTIVIPNKVENIGISFFAGNKIENVIIPDSVISIGNSAFSNNNLKSISIGKSVIYIDDNSFRLNQLTGIVIPTNVKGIGVNAFAGNQIVRISIGENVSLGSDGSNCGILGENTGFNTAYTNNKNRAGVYTRPNTRSTSWNIISQSSSVQTERLINSIKSKSSDDSISLGTQGWSVHVKQLNEPIKNCVRFTLDYEIKDVITGDPYGTQDVYVKTGNGRWVKVGSFSASNKNKVTSIIL